MDDAASAIVGGFVGTATMTLVLLAGDAGTGYRLRVFDLLADVVGLGGNAAVGFVLFFVAGSLAWPLLYITIGNFLPGRAGGRGTVFGVVLWIGFALAFTADRRGTALVVFAVLTLLAHLAYGFVLGSVHDRLSEAPRATV